MTKREFKIICKLIDLHTTHECGQYQDYDEINAEDIQKLKDDINELLVYDTITSTNTTCSDANSASGVGMITLL